MQTRKDWKWKVSRKYSVLTVPREWKDIQQNRRKTFNIQKISKSQVWWLFFYSKIFLLLFLAVVLKTSHGPAKGSHLWMKWTEHNISIGNSKNITRSSSTPYVRPSLVERALFDSDSDFRWLVLFEIPSLIVLLEYCDLIAPPWIGDMDITTNMCFWSLWQQWDNSVTKSVTKVPNNRKKTVKKLAKVKNSLTKVSKHCQ